MSLFGGSSQSSNSIQNSIDFSPIFNIGDGNKTDTRKVAEQSATVSPKIDDSMTASASVGVAGGSGGTATTSRYQNEPIVAPTNTSNEELKKELFTSGNIKTADLLKYGTYIVLGGGVLYLIKESKKKSK